MRFLNYYFKKHKIKSTLVFFGSYSYFSYWNVIQYESQGTDPLISAIANLPASLIVLLIMVPVLSRLINFLSSFLQLISRLPQKLFNYYFREHPIGFFISFIFCSWMELLDGAQEWFFELDNSFGTGGEISYLEVLNRLGEIPSSYLITPSLFFKGFLLALVFLPLINALITGIKIFFYESIIIYLKDLFEDLKYFSSDINKPSNQKCCWCKQSSRQALKKKLYCGGGPRFVNKDGSPDKRRNRNPYDGHVISMYECKYCDAINIYATAKINNVNPGDRVSLGLNYLPGNSERKGKDFIKNKMKKMEKSLIELLLSEFVNKFGELGRREYVMKQLDRLLQQD